MMSYKSGGLRDQQHVQITLDILYFVYMYVYVHVYVSFVRVLFVSSLSVPICSLACTLLLFVKTRVALLDCMSPPYITQIKKQHEQKLTNKKIGINKPIPAPLKTVGSTSMMWLGQYFL